MEWFQDNWAYLALGLLLTRDFLNHLLQNCPFLKANRTFELIQGIFDAAAQTFLKQEVKGEEDSRTGPTD